MAAQEFTVSHTFTDAEYLAMAAAANNGVGEQLAQVMGPEPARVLGRLVQSVLGSIRTAKVGSTVRYEAADWLVVGAMAAGEAGEVIALVDPDGSADPVVLTGADVDKVKAVGGGDVLWLIDAAAKTPVDAGMPDPIADDPDLLPPD